MIGDTEGKRVSCQIETAQTYAYPPWLKGKENDRASIIS
jgi:hypothetical protein